MQANQDLCITRNTCDVCAILTCRLCTRWANLRGGHCHSSFQSCRSTKQCHSRSQWLTEKGDWWGWCSAEAKRPPDGYRKSSKGRLKFHYFFLSEIRKFTILLYSPWAHGHGLLLVNADIQSVYFVKTTCITLSNEHCASHVLSENLN